MTAKDKLPDEIIDQPITGPQLRKLREQQSFSLEDVCAATRISLSNLRAIESMAYDKLPADTFTRGLLVLYGDFLGANGREIAEQFFAERVGEKKQMFFLKDGLMTPSLTNHKLAEPAHISSATIAGIMLLLIVVSFTGFCLYTSWNPFAFITKKTESLSTAVISNFHPADPASGNNRATHALSLNAQFLKDTTIILSRDNEKETRQSYVKGTTAHWDAAREMTIEFSEPGSALLYLNDATLPFPQEENGRYILSIPVPSHQ